MKNIFLPFMSSQNSRNKTNRKEKNNTDWLDKLINELSKTDTNFFQSPYM